MAVTSTILGPDGQPVKRTVLQQEHAAPTVGGVRSVWRENEARGLDPAKLARILKAADDGNQDQFLVLAEEMEERDPHYASVLGQRKRAVSLIEPIVTGLVEGGDDKIVEAVEKLVAAPAFAELVDHLLDGIAKGYAVSEIRWRKDADLWTPEGYKHRDPRFFKFDKETGQELRIKDDAFPDGKPIPPYTMLVHRPKLKSGLTLRTGLARLVSWAFMLKSFTLQDWAAFLEVFGMPLRVGKYDQQAGAEEKRTLLRAVRDLGSDAAAIIPIGMEIEFIEAKGGQGNAVFGDMADYLDKQVSKAVLGQTMTTDDGSSLSQAKVHEDVKIDIKKSDARQVSTTINRDLIVPFVAFNFGPNAPAPVFAVPVEDPEDVKTMSEALARLVPMGLKVAMADVRKKVGFGAPADGEEVLVPPAQKSKPGSQEPDEDESETASVCPHCGGTHLAASQDEITLVDQLAAEGLDQWEADIGPLVAQILNAAVSSSGYDQFLQQLNDLDPATRKFAETLAIQAMKARGDGNLGNA